MTEHTANGRGLDDLEKYVVSRIDALEKSNKIIAEEREDRTKERFASMKLSVEAALAASDKAIQKAETAVEKRFESVNEFRKTLADQTAGFVTRLEYGTAHTSVVEKVGEAVARISKIEDTTGGRAAGIGTVASVVLGVFIVLSAVVQIISAFSIIGRLPK